MLAPRRAALSILRASASLASAAAVAASAATAASRAHVAADGSMAAISLSLADRAEGAYYGMLMFVGAPPNATCTQSFARRRSTSNAHALRLHATNVSISAAPTRSPCRFTGTTAPRTLIARTAA